MTTGIQRLIHLGDKVSLIDDIDDETDCVTQMYQTEAMLRFGSGFVQRQREALRKGLVQRHQTGLTPSRATMRDGWTRLVLWLSSLKAS